MSLVFGGCSTVSTTHHHQKYAEKNEGFSKLPVGSIFFGGGSGGYFDERSFQANKIKTTAKLPKFPELILLEILLEEVIQFRNLQKATAKFKQSLKKNRV